MQRERYLSVCTKWKRIKRKNKPGGLSEGDFGILNETVSVKNVLFDSGMGEPCGAEDPGSPVTKTFIDL